METAKKVYNIFLLVECHDAEYLLIIITIVPQLKQVKVGKVLCWLLSQLGLTRGRKAAWSCLPELMGVVSSTSLHRPSCQIKSEC